MSSVSDLFFLFDEVKEYVERIRARVALADKLRAEGRDTLTAEEWTEIRAKDDAAAARQQEAIERARGEGR
jgi:hypothetical protein